MSEFFKNKTIIITGACGSVGSELLKQLLDDKYNIRELIALDNNEGALFFLEQQYLNEPRFKVFLADITDKETLINRFKGADIVFHCAALKHVVMCERSPEIAINTNIIGVKNIISACEVNSVERLIFTSSDKAVNPTNVMGTSKLMGERLVTAANSVSRKPDSIFASTRFGNVLGSSGSVLPIFFNQILSNSAVTITDKAMTRFIMSIEEAVNLLIESATIAKGGEVFVTKMPVVKITDLAIALSKELYANNIIKGTEIQFKIIGTKPGEKLYEELMSSEEMRRSLELEKYFAVLPAFRDLYKPTSFQYSNVINSDVNNPYHSAKQKQLSIDEIRRYLQKNSIIKKLNANMSKRYWPGDKEGNSK